MPTKKSPSQSPKETQATKQRQPPKQWSMYRALHEQVQSLLADAGLGHFTFHPHDTDVGKARDYDTTIMGRFVCHNPTCQSGGWSSKAIAIRIRMWRDGKYNARVYHQRCRGCNALIRPVVNASSYAERIAYRLKKWNGIQMTPPAYGRAAKAPHEKELGEGSKVDHCVEGKRSRGGDGDVEELCTSIATL
ncbi:3CxxC-type zinc finger protein [Aspergillus aculeatinus CBS 121060]|uniref:Uncharacterized protein n=1 Tax=Aspergillus aculeatinus CBS 121060 TaxID=1448322 RepID=A0ACD1GSK3_9EURO|nr:hypothetical protein BO66DRAFT_336808 [Aspergillus aculeatinus CBS 121060]RAH64236.1 hypothetical protein BO66DRAFT_336808 [Aspergillus aculeatinus CBS 121060]